MKHNPIFAKIKPFSLIFPFIEFISVIPQKLSVSVGKYKGYRKTLNVVTICPYTRGRRSHINKNIDRQSVKQRQKIFSIKNCK